MGQKLGQAELARADVVIRPQVLDIGAADFSQRANAILEGEKAALAVMPQIRERVAQLQAERAKAARTAQQKAAEAQHQACLDQRSTPAKAGRHGQAGRLLHERPSSAANKPFRTAPFGEVDRADALPYEQPCRYVHAPTRPPHPLHVVALLRRQTQPQTGRPGCQRAGDRDPRGSHSGVARSSLPRPHSRSSSRSAAPWCARRFRASSRWAWWIHARAAACTSKRRALSPCTLTCPMPHRARRSCKSWKCAVRCESEVAELAAQRRSEADVQAIREAMQRIADAVRAGRDGAEEDVEFHRAIARAAGNPFLISTLDYLAQVLQGATRVTRANEAGHWTLPGSDARSTARSCGPLSLAMRVVPAARPPNTCRMHSPASASRRRLLGPGRRATGPACGG